MINIDDLTIKQARELAELFNRSAAPTRHEVHPYEIGNHYLFRLATVYDTGTIVAVYPQEIVIENASWIPDTGRFADAVKKAEFSEVEPFPDGQVIISRGAIIDAVKINKVPRSQK